LQEIFSWIAQILDGTTSTNPVVKLRSLWFIEQIAGHKKTFKSDDLLRLNVFKTLANMFCAESSTDFVSLYCAMQALSVHIKYCLKLISETEPELGVNLVLGICSVTLHKILPHCNNETVDSPVALLKQLIEIDNGKLIELSNLILPQILIIFEKYHKDAMLAEDILGLISTIAKIPQNHSFTMLIVPQVLNVVLRYHNFAVVEHNRTEAQSLIDSGMLKAMFTILSDYWVANADNI